MSKITYLLKVKSAIRRLLNSINIQFWSREK